jgi:hypothetical protein
MWVEDDARIGLSAELRPFADESPFARAGGLLSFLRNLVCMCVLIQTEAGSSSLSLQEGMPI